MHPIKIFCCSAEEDSLLLQDLERHLSPLRNMGQVTSWSALEIMGGTETSSEIEKNFQDADIILLLLSAYFIASKDLYNFAVGKALQKHRNGAAQVIPVILRPVLWEETPLGTLRALPNNKKPVTLWANPEEALLDIVQSISEIIPKPPLFLQKSDKKASSQIQAVIALNFATPDSMIAYAYAGDREVHVWWEWPYSDALRSSAPAHLLYSPDGMVVAWGFEAIAKYASLRQQRQHKGYHFLANFKMAFYEQGDKAWGNERLVFKNGQPTLLKESIDDNRTKEFSLNDVISDYLRCLVKFVLEKIKREISRNLDELAIQWCLTIPDACTEEQKKRILLAWKRLSLITFANGKELLLISESKAALIACMNGYIDHTDLMPHESSLCYMLGNVKKEMFNVTVHEVVPNKGQNFLNEVVPSLASPYGSAYIDNLFREHIKHKFGAQIIQAILDEEPIGYREMMLQWERRRADYLGSEGRVTLIYFQRIYRFLLHNYPEVLQRLGEEQDGFDDAFVLDNDFMHALFRPFLDNVANLMEEQFTRLGTRRCDSIFLVGDFSASLLLQACIKERFREQTMRIVIPHDPETTIVQGAVLYGFDPVSVYGQQRVFYTYGIDVAMPFEDGIDPEDKKFPSARTREALCQNRFDILIVSEDSIKQDHTVTRRYAPLEVHQRRIVLSICITKHKLVRYTDESDVRKLDDLIISRADTSSGFDWTIEMAMYFSANGLEIDVKDSLSRDRVHKTFNFKLLDALFEA